MNWLLLILPLGIIFSLLITTPWSHFIFFFDSSLKYSHGNGFLLLYSLSTIYLILSFLTVVLHRKALNLNKRLFIYLYYVVIFISVLIQYFNPWLLLQLFAQTVCQLGILITVENVDEIYSNETHAYNRTALKSRMKIIESNHGSLQAIIIKLGKLQFLNSSLGLVKVNSVTQAISLYLASLDKQAVLFDCGNGHFILTTDSLEKRITITQLLRERFGNPWEVEQLKLNIPYELSPFEYPKEIDSLEKIWLMIDLPFQEGGKILYNSQVERYQRLFFIEKALAEAIQKKSFQVFYQPIYSIKENRINSCEALLRLYDDTYGFISPEEFIPIAEKNGMIIDIGLFVIEEVCKFITQGRLESLGIDYVEINLSVVQCMQENLFDEILDIMNRYEIPPKKINLEITESTAASMSYNLLQNMKELAKKGITFSIDDYGTGYSSISYLFELPFSFVKLDREIIWAMVSNDKAHITVESTINMIRSLGLSTIAEGVESNDQLEELKKMNCDFIQGYYFSKPLPKEEFLNYLDKQK